MKIDTHFNFGDTVYMKLGEQLSGHITAIYCRPASRGVHVAYEVMLENGETRNCYEFEFSKEKAEAKQIKGLRK